MAQHRAVDVRLSSDHLWYTIYGNIVWIVFFSHQIGSFLGVWLGGYFYDTTGSYDPIWWAGIALGFTAAILHWPIHEKTRAEAVNA